VPVSMVLISQLNFDTFLIGATENNKMIKSIKNYALNCLCLIALATLAGPTTAHTFAVGTTAGSGTVQMWFRGWHSCGAPLLEGSIRIEGVNGTTFGPVTGLTTLSSCDSVGGTSTFPSFGDPSDVGYYCEVDVSGNIIGAAAGTTASLGYDPNNPITDTRFLNRNLGAVGTILCSEDIEGDGDPSNKWQGSEFTGLAAGTYEITYLECDVDGSATPDASDCAGGSSPSVDYTIDYDLIAQVDITVSAAVIAASGPSIPVPTMSIYALMLTTLGLLLVATRRLRLLTKRE
jgi:hypothetical protein